MSEPSDRDMEALRTLARERIGQGRLPCTKAFRTWVGLGSGTPCALCDATISTSEPEFELQVEASEPTRTVRFHRKCHSLWSEVREEYAPLDARPPGTEHLPRGS